MKTAFKLLLFAGLVLVGSLCPVSWSAEKGDGFQTIFDGQTLKGWKAVGKQGEGYVPKDGVLFCPATGGGNLFTEKEYDNFVFRFEFKLTQNANNGVGIRAPLEGDAAYMGMEIQVLHDDGSEYKALRPEQYHGSVYDLVAAKRGAQKPLDEWNTQEITANGRNIKIVLNGVTIVDTDLNDIHDPAKIQKHPGLLRERGHIGFLGHGTQVEFRNIRVKELPASERADNIPPAGFKALFNGKDLTGWKGLVADPPKRAKMTAAELAEKQQLADKKMREHWNPENGVLLFDGKGDNLCTVKDYANFEMLVDWKIHGKGDSGIYLRGSPQVQIWDPNNGGPNPADPKNAGPNPRHEGSGGLYNNQKNPSGPLKLADNPIGEWNRFRIVMVGEKVHIFLNGVLVVNNTTLENYWERSLPIYPSGAIELQNHGDLLYFKNVFVRELPNP